MKKIGRNDICPCGSGLKYKHCCLKKKSLGDKYNQISRIVKDNGYSDDLTDLIYRMLRYIHGRPWLGACHSSCACLYVAMKESGFNPILCTGEVKRDGRWFDHSWLELDGKVIDLAISAPLPGEKSSPAVVFNIEISTNNSTKLTYGSSSDIGLDPNTRLIINTSVSDYMDADITRTNGLWDITNLILSSRRDISILRAKYKDVMRSYIVRE